MKAQIAVLTTFAVCVAWFAGCGGNQSGTVETEPVGQTVISGPLQIGVAATAGFRQLPIPTPSSSPVALTAFYGSKITRLAQMGPGKIAFTLNDDAIAAIMPDGSGQRTLTDAGIASYYPAWSPSGKKIAFSSSRASDRDLYIVNSDGTGETRVTNGTASVYESCWSPDGRRLAYDAYSSGNWDIFVVNTDGSNPVNPTNHAANDISPSWSPNGREMLFASDRDGDYEIFAMEPDGTDLRQLTTNTYNDKDPSWSPDGQRIVFRSNRDMPDEISVMNADGSSQNGLDTAGSEPRYTSDGREIVFQSALVAHLSIMRANGSRLRPLGEAGLIGTKPGCSPIPARARTLVGKAKEDNGSNPPFGAACHLAITGISDADGLVEAAALLVGNWNPLKVSMPNYGGYSLAAVAISGTALQAMVEDRGRGLPVRRWSFPTNPATGSATVFFAASTGQIRSILTSSDSVVPTAVGGAEAKGGRLVLHGSFTSVMDARDPSANLAPGLARQATIDASTGQVLGSQ